MSNKLYIASMEARSGKSMVALGIMEMLSRRKLASKWMKIKITSDLMKSEKFNVMTALSTFWSYQPMKSWKLPNKQSQKSAIFLKKLKSQF